MSSISIFLRKQIERTIEERALEEDEFRRINGMGDHFMSLTAEHDGKQFFFSTVVGEQVIYIFKEMSVV